MDRDALELFRTVALHNAKGNSTICKIVISFREQINDDGNMNILLLSCNTDCYIHILHFVWLKEMNTTGYSSLIGRYINLLHSMVLYLP